MTYQELILLIEKNRGHFWDRIFLQKLGEETFNLIVTDNRVGLSKTYSLMVTNMDLWDIWSKIGETLKIKYKLEE